MKFEVNLSKKFKLTSLKNLKLTPSKNILEICWLENLWEVTPLIYYKDQKQKFKDVT